MKKMMIAAAAMSALLCTVMTGCSINIDDDTMSQAANVAASMLDDADIKVNGQDVNVSVDSNGDVNVSIAQTTAVNNNASVSTQTTAATVAATETAAVQTTTAAPAVLSDAEMKNISKQLIQKYVNIYDGLLCGCTEVDDTDFYEESIDCIYYRVMDPNMQSIADVKAILAKTLTDAEYDRLYSYIFDAQRPTYMELNGKLYTAPLGRGGAYSDTWNWDGLQFTNVTADSFTVTGSYTHMGDASYSQPFDIVNTLNGYRICNVGKIVYP